MTQWLLGTLIIVMGLMAAGVGAMFASQSLRTAHRTYRKTTSLSTRVPEGWDAWFLGGFSRFTMGMRAMMALAAWITWTLAGVGLIGLGIRLFDCS